MAASDWIWFALVIGGVLAGYALGFSDGQTHEQSKEALRRLDGLMARVKPMALTPQSSNQQHQCKRSSPPCSTA